ncbi:MAG: hypothetical protein MRQ09_00140 [Candidatus Midichloria sp.]|nr:hypothetical protein [Candidatus Midichloria sp.]
MSLEYGPCDQYGLEDVVAFHSYSGHNVTLCKTPSWRDFQLPTWAKVFLSLTVFNSGNYIKDYVFKDDRHKAGFWQGLKSAFWMTISCMDLFDIAKFPKAIPYSPALLFDMYGAAKSWYYQDVPITSAQVFVKDLSVLQPDNHYYLAQAPSKCAQGDKTLYHFVGNSSYNICQARDYSTAAQITNALGDAIVLIPAVSTVLTCAFAFLWYWKY